MAWRWRRSRDCTNYCKRRARNLRARMPRSNSFARNTLRSNNSSAHWLNDWMNLRQPSPPHCEQAYEKTDSHFVAWVIDTRGRATRLCIQLPGKAYGQWNESEWDI